MYVNAIEKVDQYTRPIHSILRTYGGLISPATATLFFVNDNGVAITCKHVLQFIAQADNVNKNYIDFKSERDKLPKNGLFHRKLRDLEKKYNYKKDTVVQIKNNFIGCFDKITHVQWHQHPQLDLAIIEFKGQAQNLYDAHATFVNDPNKIKQGRSLCRLGYPFPEFDNFQLNAVIDDIEWTQQGNATSPKFPIDGIISRFGIDNGVLATIELTTPGLKGQSGGPLFDSDGLIYGMQFMTSHLHLGFDINSIDVISGGKKMTVTNHPFLHVGHCVHVDRIKEFLKLHNIPFHE